MSKGLHRFGKGNIFTLTFDHLYSSTSASSLALLKWSHLHVVSPCGTFFCFWCQVCTPKRFYHADTALRRAPLVCIIGVSPHRQHTTKVYYGVLFQYNFLNLRVPVSVKLEEDDIHAQAQGHGDLDGWQADKETKGWMFRLCNLSEPCIINLTAEKKDLNIKKKEIDLPLFLHLSLTLNLSELKK